MDDIRSMGSYLAGVASRQLQNFVAGVTLDPEFDGRSFEREELAAMRAVAREYVQACGIRN